VRFVHDASCVPVIDNVVLSRTGDDSFDNMLGELRARGYSRTDRKYLVWMDANVYCGIGQVYFDDYAGPQNSSNGSPAVAGEVGRIDKGCWGLANLTEAHELTHVLGGVQTSAPDATPGSHCTDEYDRLCYSDGTGFAQVVCPDSSHENRLDCNHDDYYSTSPAPGSYLANHWNVANSRFLTAGATSAPATTPPTSSPPTTSPPATPPPTTSPPTTPPPTTAPPPPTTVPPPPPTSPPTTGPPTSQVAASAPSSLFATQPSGAGRGVLLFWSPPASVGNPPFTAYRIYRGPGPTSLSPLVDVGAETTSYNDASAAGRVIYWYVVKALNPAGESPPSNLTRMVGR
jgi:cell division septation protein DedD